MKYFQSLPKILVTNEKGVSTLYTNIMARASLISDLLNDPLIFYKYDIQDGDTPEIVADKFYGDSYRFWLIMLANQLSDPQWDWPLNSSVFNKYIEDKYQDIDPYTTVYQYEKIITQYDSSSRTTTVEKYVIDENTYDSLIPSTTTYNFPSSTTTISVSKESKTYFEHELELNEEKRSIKLLKKEYVPRVEDEFSKLMSQ